MCAEKGEHFVYRLLAFLKLGICNARYVSRGFVDRQAPIPVNVVNSALGQNLVKMLCRGVKNIPCARHRIARRQFAERYDLLRLQVGIIRRILIVNA